ncbi:hypothetical protein ACC782_33580 [Rhizobium ruizarguesonis]
MRILFTFMAVVHGLLAVAFSNADMRGATLLMIGLCAMCAAAREAAQ